MYRVAQFKLVVFFFFFVFAFIFTLFLQTCKGVGLDLAVVAALLGLSVAFNILLVIVVMRLKKQQ